MGSALKRNLYTNVVLTIIALLLGAIAYKLYGDAGSHRLKTIISPSIFDRVFGASQPTLTRVVLKTWTDGEDQDSDTSIGVSVWCNYANGAAWNDPNIAAAWIDNAERNNNDNCNDPNSRHYCDGSRHDFDVTVREHIPKSQCNNFQWMMGIEASGAVKIGDLPVYHLIPLAPEGGNDKWMFDAFLTLTFSDGSTFSANKMHQTLNSRGGRPDWDEPSGHNGQP